MHLFLKDRQTGCFNPSVCSLGLWLGLCIGLGLGLELRVRVGNPFIVFIYQYFLIVFSMYLYYKDPQTG